MTGSLIGKQEQRIFLEAIVAGCLVILTCTRRDLFGSEPGVLIAPSTGLLHLMDPAFTFLPLFSWAEMGSGSRRGYCVFSIWVMPRVDFSSFSGSVVSAG